MFDMVFMKMSHEYVTIFFNVDLVLLEMMFCAEKHNEHMLIKKYTTKHKCLI